VPDELVGEARIKLQLLKEFFHYFPELKGMKIRHEYFQLRDDFPGFQTGAYAERPEIKTEVDNLYLAGDWVKMDNCSMLMEAAYTSGAIAANDILEKEGLRQNLLQGVPQKGLFA
jgi:isorenieratene synthase